MTHPFSSSLGRGKGLLAQGIGVLLVAIPLGLAGCSTVGHRGASLVPTRYQVRTGPFLIYSDMPIPADSTAVRCLHSLETDLDNRLGYHPRTDEDPVEIYILNDRNAYSHFLKFYYPELPPRRAFFLAQGDRRVVYTYLSDRLEEDLRHEATHALIRGGYGDLPLWLDEGLAEYFESQPTGTGGPDEHLTKVTQDLRSGWKPDLARLESLKDIHQMTPRDYRESWAWVDLLLDNQVSGRSALIEYLGQRSTTKPRPPLSELLAARQISADSLKDHLEAEQERLAAGQELPRPLSMTASSSSSQAMKVRTRQAGPEVDTEPAIVRAQTPSRPGLLRRIGSWFGF